MGSAALNLWTLNSQLSTQTQRCAPGRADRFQTCPTGFDSSHRCLSNCRRGSKQKGAGPVNRIMRVRIPPSALKPCGCDGQHVSLRNCRTRFDSSAGHLIHNYVLGVWRIRMRPCEGRGPGSIPGGGTFYFDNTTPMLDGRAAACKAAQSEFDSHRCLFNACLDAVVAGGALGLRVSLTYSVNGF